MENMTIDTAIQESFPVLIAPIDSQLPPAKKSGVRHILGSTGVYREISTGWMVRRKLHGRCNLPYGAISELLEFSISSPPVQLWRDFTEAARKALPSEVAGLLIWNATTQTWRMALRIALQSNSDFIHYRNPELEDDEVAIVDIHSHGRSGAWFSATDNNDDAGGIKISAVIGRVHQSTPELVMRLVAIDEFIPLALAQDGKFHERLQ